MSITCHIGFLNELKYKPIINNIFSLLKNDFICDIVDCEINKFSDGEVDLIYKSGNFDFIVILHSLELPFLNLEMLLLKIQKGSLLSKKIIVIITYLAYLRQSLEKTLGEKILELLLSFKEVVKIIIIDPHLLNIKSRKILIIRTNGIFYKKINELITSNKFKDQLILLPDRSSLTRNKKIINNLKIKSIVVDKLRNSDTITSKISSSITNSNGNIIIIDDIIDTGNTILNAIEAYLSSVKCLKINPSFYIFCTHGVFSKVNCKFLSNKLISKIYLSTTLKRIENDKIEYVDISKILAKEISKIIKNTKGN